MGRGTGRCKGLSASACVCVCVRKCVGAEKSCGLEEKEEPLSRKALR